MAPVAGRVVPDGREGSCLSPCAGRLRVHGAHSPGGARCGGERAPSPGVTPSCGVGMKSALSLSVNEVSSRSSSPRSCRTSRCCRSSGTGCGRSPGRRKVRLVAQWLWASARSVPDSRALHSSQFWLSPMAAGGRGGALAGPRASGLGSSLGPPGLQNMVADLSLTLGEEPSLVDPPPAWRWQP